MQRDMDIIRSILFEVEKIENSDNWQPENLEQYTQEEINYHLMLLKEAELIKATSLNDGNIWVPERLTWDGHDFLDASRNETVWKRVKGKIAEMGGSLAFEMIKSLLITGSAELLNK